MRQEIVPEESYRTRNVEGAIVTSMGLVTKENGGVLAFIDFDDSEGMATYNLSAKGDIAGVPDAKDTGKWNIPGYFDFAKISKALKEHGYIPYIDVENNGWETEPPLVGKKVWIEGVKTGTGADGTEYIKYLKIIKIEDGGQQPAAQQLASPQSAPPNKQADQQADGSDDLKGQWTNILNDILTDGPQNEIEINTAVRKAFPNDATIRKQLADVRKPTLTVLVSEGVLELTDDGKYQLAV